MISCRFTFIALFTFVCLNANSQIFTGGNISINTNKNSSPDNTYSIHDIIVSPDIGKYFSEKLASGISFNLLFRQNKSDIANEQKYSSIGVSPFLKYYFYRSKKFSLFGQGNVGLDFQKVKEFQDPEERNKVRTYISFNPGVSYDLTDHFLLQTSLYFLSFKYDYITTIDGSPKHKTTEFSFNSGLDNIISLFNLRIGAVYKF